jgi:hypothetical protein
VVSEAGGWMGHEYGAALRGKGSSLATFIAQG